MDRAEVMLGGCVGFAFRSISSASAVKKQRTTRGMEREEARKDGDLVVLGAERGTSMGGFTDPT